MSSSYDRGKDDMVNMLKRQFNGESGQSIFDQLVQQQLHPNNSRTTSGEIQIETARRTVEAIQTEPIAAASVTDQPEEEQNFMNVSPMFLFQPDRWASVEHYANILERVYDKKAQKLGLEISKPLSFRIPQGLNIELMDMMYNTFNMILVGMPTISQVGIHTKNMNVLYPNRDEYWTQRNSSHVIFGNAFEEAVRVDHSERDTLEQFGYKNPRFAGTLFFIETPDAYDPEYEEDDPFFYFFDEYPLVKSMHRCQSWEITQKILNNINEELNQTCKDHDLDVTLKVVLAPASNFINRMLFPETDEEGNHRILTGRPFQAVTDSLITVGANADHALSKFGFAPKKGFALNDPWTVRFAVMIDKD